MILTTKPLEFTGNFFIDEILLKENGVTDFSKYLYDKTMKDDDLIEDFFLPWLPDK